MAMLSGKALIWDRELEPALEEDKASCVLQQPDGTSAGQLELVTISLDLPSEYLYEPVSSVAITLPVPFFTCLPQTSPGWPLAKSRAQQANGEIS
jgi:hypothetical protein